ncbi:MAG: hypothetical protein LBD25_00885 [Coriobacteriales bacterium]|nr:hypothetical protein [Coriobacteriales bacterium]
MAAGIWLLAALVLLSFALSPSPALGLADDTLPEPDELQQRIEGSAMDYNESMDRLASIEAEILVLERRLADVERRMPEQQERGEKAAAEFYRMQCSSSLYLEMLFGSQSISDFFANFEYITRLQNSYYAEFDQLKELDAELREMRTSLEEQYRAALDETTHAAEALADAQQAREDAERRAAEIQQSNGNAVGADGLPSPLEAVGSEAAGGEGQGAGSGTGSGSGSGNGSGGGIGDMPTVPPVGGNGNDNASSSGNGNGNGSGNGGQGTTGSNPGPDTGPAPGAGGASPGVGNDRPDWTTDKKSFVSEWGARIDAYLGSSPLGGHGSAFAEAAWDYGVDPRWSPAISCIESSKGRYCFLSHNAWGWGNTSWSDWDTAIREHVRGLKRGYGYTISVEAAQKYCPPNWEHWYNATLSEMQRI